MRLRDGSASRGAIQSPRTTLPLAMAAEAGGEKGNGKVREEEEARRSEPTPSAMAERRPLASAGEECQNVEGGERQRRGK